MGRTARGTHRQAPAGTGRHRQAPATRQSAYAAFRQLTAIGVGGIIGAGIFTLLGLVIYFACSYRKSTLAKSPPAAEPRAKE